MTKPPPLSPVAQQGRGLYIVHRTMKGCGGEGRDLLCRVCFSFHDEMQVYIRYLPTSRYACVNHTYY